jgi:O-antigen/teichoic acid export membrane protein
MEVQQPSSSDGPGVAHDHWRRLLHGIGANLLGKFWLVVGQVASVPILLSVWGPKGYGLWLMVSAIPSYAVLSDFGFGSAAAVLMTQMVAKDEKAEALQVFQSVGVLVSGILTVMLLASVAVFFSFPFLAHLFGLNAPQPDVAWAFLILMVYSAAIASMGVVGVGFRSTKRYARGTILYDLPMPLETAALLIAALTTRSYVICAAAQLAVRIPAFILYYSRLRLDEPWLHMGWSKASWDIIKRLTKPSLANFALPFALAMSVQGVVFTVGLGFGPAAAGMFGAVRTFTRLPLQLVAVLTRASGPELTIAHTLTNRPLIARLTALNLAMTFVTFAPFILASPWGGLLMHVMTGGRMAVHPDFYVTMEIVAAIQATWSTLAIFLLAENKLQKIVPWCLTAGFAAMLMPLALAHRVQLTELAMALGCLDFIVLIAAARIWWRESGLAVSDFVALARDPIGLISRGSGSASAHETAS